MEFIYPRWIEIIEMKIRIRNPSEFLLFPELAQSDKENAPKMRLPGDLEDQTERQAKFHIK